MIRRLFLPFAILVAACGGDPGVAQPTHPPPREVLGLALRVAAAHNDTFCPALEFGLSRSGIAIASEPTEHADATLTCHVNMGMDDGFLRITQNGETRMKFTVRVEVRNPASALVDQFIAEYTGFKSSGPDEDAVNKLVIAFAYSPRIAAFARQVKSGAFANMTVTAPPPDPTESSANTNPNDRRDDADWFAIETVRCKIPSRIDACNQVRNYLQRHPGGAHVDEANAILAAAQPALEKLQKEDIAWQKSGRNECMSKRTSEACVGVEAYEMEFPSGQHASEARRLLKNVK